MTLHALLIIITRRLCGFKNKRYYGMTLHALLSQGDCVALKTLRGAMA